MSNKDPIVWFGMKLTPEEKARIQKLADLQGLNQKEAVLQAVEEKIASYEVEPQKGSLLEKLRPFAGVVTDPEKDRSTNKKHMEGYGEPRRR